MYANLFFSYINSKLYPIYIFNLVYNQFFYNAIQGCICIYKMFLYEKKKMITLYMK